MIMLRLFLKKAEDLANNIPDIWGTLNLSFTYACKDEGFFIIIYVQFVLHVSSIQKLVVMHKFEQNLAEVNNYLYPTISPYNGRKAPLPNYHRFPSLNSQLLYLPGPIS